jgi:phospholipase C
VLENHDYLEIVGSSNAPYINSLIAEGGLATNYLDSGTHPSLPNYLYMVSGSPQYLGVLDWNPTQFIFPVDADNLGNQMQLAGITWRAYQESMGTPCLLTTSGHYAPKHDPFLYFKNIQLDTALCAETSVDYTHFAADLLAGTHRYSFITPNLLSDGHDPSTNPVLGLQQSDAWLQANVPAILSSAAYLSGGVLFITWDEAEGRGGRSNRQVPMIILSPRLVSAGFQSNHAYTHASYLATVEHILGLPLLGDAATSDNMMEFFQ